MRRGILSAWALLLVSLLAAMPAAAQDLPIPRSYPQTGTQRADPGRSAETAVADPFAAACDAGDMAGCTALGQAFETGKGRPQNRPVAELLYRQACDADEAAACVRLGKLLRSADDRADWPLTAPLFAKACRLGVAAGCDAAADDLDTGLATGTSDPGAALALRRSTCAGGSAESCQRLADALLRYDPASAEHAEGLALLDRQCRAGQARVCDDAARYWERAEDGYGRRTAEYQSLGCAAGDSWACTARGKRALQNGVGPEARAAATAFYDRACALSDYHCPVAAMVADEPRIAAACSAGDRSACIALGQLHAEWNGPFADQPRAVSLLGAACETAVEADDMLALCEKAGDLALDLAGAPEGEAMAGLDPARIEGFLLRGCGAGSELSCARLADGLWRGDLLKSDPPRAIALYAGLCDRGDRRGCRGLESAIRADASAPLLVAGGDLDPPEYSPAEIAEQRRIAKEQRLRDEAEELARACTTTDVEFRGGVYVDTICMQVVAVINGFTVPRGDAPWQALLWRPEKLGRRVLQRADRVLCGGAVVRTGWVLTAAHCLTDVDGIAIQTGGHRIRLGVANPLADEGFSYPILRVIPHPGFRTNTLVYDIALVQYDPAAGRREGGPVQPIAAIRLDPQPLAKRVITARMPVYTFGWGRTAYEGGATPSQLRGARLELEDAKACTALTAFRDGRRDAVLCAAGPQGQQACFGDSGGPLITYGDAGKVPTVIGVVSSGVKCGTTSVPSRFTRIAHPRVDVWLRSHLPPADRR